MIKTFDSLTLIVKLHVEKNSHNKLINVNRIFINPIFNQY
jgi:hypothetical protein